MTYDTFLFNLYFWGIFDVFGTGASIHTHGEIQCLAHARFCLKILILLVKGRPKIFDRGIFSLLVAFQNKPYVVAKPTLYFARSLRNVDKFSLPLLTICLEYLLSVLWLPVD